MKEYITLVPFLLLSLPLAPALDLAVGVQGGLSGSLVSGQDYNDFRDFSEAFFEAAYGQSYSHQYRPRLAFMITGFLTVGVGSKLALQPEVSYGHLHGGYRLQNDHESDDYIDLTFKYELIQGNLLLRLLLGGSRRKGIYLVVGPAILYLNSRPPQLEIDDSILGSDEGDFGGSSDYKEYAFAAVAGIDYRRDIWAGPFFWNFGLRVRYQLTSFDDYGPPMEDDTKIHSLEVLLGLGRRSR